MGWLFSALGLAMLTFLIGSSPARSQALPSLSTIFQFPKTVATSAFPRPVWMAIVSDETGARFLLKGGDPVFEGDGPQPIGLVETVTPLALTLALPRGWKARAFPGHPVPGCRRLVLREVVLVSAVEYRNRVVDPGARKILGGEVYLLGLEGSRAILQRDVDPPPSAAELMHRRLEALRIVEVAPRVWHLNPQDVQEALESGEALLKHGLVESRLDMFRLTGTGLEIKTPIAEVQVDHRGFVVSDSNLAGRLGITVGDRIIGINGLPIDGFSDLYRAYQSIKNDPTVKRVDLTIERQKTPQTLTYHIR